MVIIESTPGIRIYKWNLAGQLAAAAASAVINHGDYPHGVQAEAEGAAQRVYMPLGTD
jgi:hypothetical protein